MKRWEIKPDQRQPMHAIATAKCTATAQRIVLTLMTAVLAGCWRGDQEARIGKPTQERGANVSVASDDVMPRVRSAIADGKLEIASTLLNQRLVGNPNDAEALLYSAQIAALRGQVAEAIAIADEIDIKHPLAGIRAGELVAQQAAAANQDKLAIQKLTALLEHHGDQPRWHHSLWVLLNRQGRRAEASFQADLLCKAGQATLEESLSLIRRGHYFSSSKNEVLSSGLPPPRLSEALAAFSRRDFATAQQLLRSEFDSEFSSPAAAALYGRVLAEAEQFDEIPKWLGRCGQAAKDEPHYWAALGIWLGSQHQYREAIGASLVSIERDSTDRVSYQRIASWLHAIDQRALGDQFWHRALQLSDAELLSGMDGAASGTDIQDQQPMRKLALQLLELGRPFESMQWTLHAIGQSDPVQRSVVFDRLRQLRTNSQLDDVMREHFRIGLDPAEYPFDDGLVELLAKNSDRPGTSVRPVAPSPLVTPVLDEVAAGVGLEFTVVPKNPEDRSTLKMHEALGSGIAVIDFDLDGWPDLYFGQAGGSPPALESNLSDALFRNAGGTFTNITDQAGVAEFGYTLGVAAGDVNQDGFSDLLVGNLGMNRLFINNGDGTFLDQTERLGSQRGGHYERLIKKLGELPYLEGLFTTSVAIADVNGDHLPDVYTANYVELEDLFVPPKPDRHGRVFQNTPRASFAESDQCYFQRAPGGFVRQDIAPAVAAPASSLGIVIADIDGQGGNEIFVGNDARPNHLLSFSERTGWHNRADVLGVANNAEGLSTACMGIAAADFDANGMLDLLITNFATEPACFYLQDDAGRFLDQQFRFGLDALTRPAVGFGCKAIDFGHDGWHDLVITNGHVDPEADGDFEMLPQCLVRQGDRFEAVTPESNGNYWQSRHVGRSVATLDYDRDGSLDLVINHIASPTALFRNRTPSLGSFIQLELVGRRSERDAIGAKVLVNAEGTKRVQWVTAGDGYFCSDEALVEISFGNSAQISSLEVHWPSGLKQTFADNIKPNRRYLIVEDEALFERER